MQGNDWAKKIVANLTEKLFWFQARQKRLERSKQNNPNYKKGDKPADGDSADKKDKKGGKKSAEATNEVDRPQFAGAASDPKVKNLPKHTGLFIVKVLRTWQYICKKRLG